MQHVGQGQTEGGWYSAESERPPSLSYRIGTETVLPVVLFLATCTITLLVGGFAFAVSLMTILTAHELGHFLQMRRYRVSASLPYFVPILPQVGPIGTAGAVVLMQPGTGNRKALFDIAVTGPLVGLGLSLAFCWIGLSLSDVQPVVYRTPFVRLGDPLLFKLLGYWTFGSLTDGYDIFLHPVGYAGWVGIFVTALNLIPIGQLDGGHILYALLRKKAYPVAMGLLLAAAAVTVLLGYWIWLLLVVLIALIGPIHPPTADDQTPLGLGRVILGWALLLFVVVGFTPSPFMIP